MVGQLTLDGDDGDDGDKRLLWIPIWGRYSSFRYLLRTALVNISMAGTLCLLITGDKKRRFLFLQIHDVPISEIV
ncbi:unnamed protein product [Pseudo-nitzschia multistriata]|uniref:Uncharacterized protein n=1 Tax=Pseudo-nitzschia multistriata TaxID=183589 RepID=A0A448ZHF9_9STRA|nr:unnamed protein product [Pseudo-nitzschia multistriata]